MEWLVKELKGMYNEVLVVEGKNDKARILALFPNLEVITTNGSEISEITLNMLEELSKTHKIILFLDPDYPGERIRNIILNRIPNCENIFINKHKAIDYKKKKVGVEHATDVDLIMALENRITCSNLVDTITIVDLYSLGLIGQQNSKEKREFLADYLHIGSPNGKTILKRLNFLQLTYEKVSEILNAKNWNN